MSTGAPPVDEGSRTAPEQDNNNLTSSPSAFSIHVPALSKAQRDSLRSDVVPAPNGVTPDASVPVIILESDEEENNVGEKEKVVGTKTEGVFRIVRGQEVDGINRSFIVQLKEGEKMVKVSEKVLSLRGCRCCCVEVDSGSLVVANILFASVESDEDDTFSLTTVTDYWDLDFS